MSKMIEMTEKNQLLAKTDSDYGAAKPVGVLNTVVRVDLICCHLEADMVMEILNPLEDVLELNVSVTERQAHIRHNASLTPKRIVELINEKHLGASLAEAGKAGEVDDSWKRSEIIAVIKGVLQVVLFCTGLFLMFGTGDCNGHADGNHCDDGWSGIHTGGDSLVGLTSSDLNSSEIAANLLWSISILLSYELFHHAYLACLRLRPNVEFLMSVAVIGSLIQGDFMAGALVCIILLIMDLIKHQAFSLVQKRLKSMITEAPATVSLLPKKVQGNMQPSEVVEIKDLKLGMEFRIREGEMIPCDGLVLSGSNVTVDEKQITGEAEPVHKKKGDDVMSGALVNSGFLDIRATALPDDSFQGSVSAAVSRASETRSETQAVVSKIAYYYTPCVILIAIAVALIEWDLNKFLVILVAGCPCGLLGATPLVHGTAIALLASEKYKLLVKSASAIEGMAHIKCIGLDKTGTITEGQFQLINLCGFDENGNIQDDYSPAGHLPILKNLLMWASCVETGDNHPIARSIVQSWDGCAVAAASAMSMDVELVEGTFAREGRVGVYGQVETKPEGPHAGNQRVNHLVGVGNDDFLKKLKIPLPSKIEKVYDSKDWKQRGLCLFITVDGRVAGMMVLEDTIRPDATETIRQLGELGLTTALLTGDKGPPAMRAAMDVGITDDVVIQAKKLGLLEHLQSEGLNVQKEMSDLQKKVKRHGIGGIFAGLLPHHKSEWVLKATHGVKHIELDGQAPDEMSVGQAKKDGYEEMSDVEAPPLAFDSTTLPSGPVPVAFVGDGMNDMVALAKATVGITIQDIGNAAIIGAADVILQGDFGNLAAGIVIARRVNMLVIANIILAITMNLAVMVIATFWHMPLWVSVMCDNGSLMIVLLNSLWPLCWNVPVVKGVKVATETGGKLSYFETREERLKANMEYTMDQITVEMSKVMSPPVDDDTETAAEPEPEVVEGFADVFTIKSVKGPQEGYYLAAPKKKCNRHDDPPSSYALLHSPGSAEDQMKGHFELKQVSAGVFSIMSAKGDFEGRYMYGGTDPKADIRSPDSSYAIIQELGVDPWPRDEAVGHWEFVAVGSPFSGMFMIKCVKGEMNGRLISCAAPQKDDKRKADSGEASYVIMSSDTSVTGHFQLQSINRPEAPIALKASVFTIKSVKGKQEGYYLAAPKKKCNRHDDPPSSYALLHSPGSDEDQMMGHFELKPYSAGVFSIMSAKGDFEGRYMYGGTDPKADIRSPDSSYAIIQELGVDPWPTDEAVGLWEFVVVSPGVFTIMCVKGEMKGRFISCAAPQKDDMRKADSGEASYVVMSSDTSVTGHFQLEQV